MPIYGFLLCALLVVLTHSSIFSYTAQAEELQDTSRYHLDKQTIEKGYSVVSADRRFTVAVNPGILPQESDVSLTTLSASKAMMRSYEFAIISDGVNPLLKKPLVALFDVGGEPRYRYWRMYYYHPRSSVWLSLHSRFNPDRQILMSDRLDFSEGIIGIAGGDNSLPDRIAESFSLASSDKQGADSGGPNTFTIVLNSDILEKGYTMQWEEITLAVPPLALRAPSEVVITWSKEEQLLDYNIRTLDGEGLPLAPEALLTIKLAGESQRGAAAKKIVFWDNNLKNWRDLPSSYDERGEVVAAKTPFHFGKYKVVEDEGVYTGEASWFKDRLISKTRMAGASNDFPIGARVLVTDIESGKQVAVEILSTGPYVEGRIIDLTYSAFAKIANPKQGIATVRVEKAL